jgi:SAM-dependent methyltransferase
LEKFDAYLRERPVHSATDWFDRQRALDEMRRGAPMIASNCIDVVVSNCVLNLVTLNDRIALFTELYRVLRAGGRAVISDIVSDREIPADLQNDPELWSGCISGAFLEPDFIATFQRAGFQNLEILHRQREPWTTIRDIEFRSMTLCAYKPGGETVVSLPVATNTCCGGNC